MKFPAQMSLGEKKKKSGAEEKVLEQHSVGCRGGRVEAVFFMFFYTLHQF